MAERLDFYRHYFPNEADACRFVERCKATEGSHAAKLIMNQTQRLVALSQDLEKLRPKRDGLQLMFLLICAENVAKLHAGFDGEGQSRAFVQKFFDQFLDAETKRELVNGFTPIELDPSKCTLPKIIDGLYSVRCDVVHRGNYWSFSLSDDEGESVASLAWDYTASLTVEDLRRVVVQGSVRAAESRLGAIA